MLINTVKLFFLPSVVNTVMKLLEEVQFTLEQYRLGFLSVSHLSSSFQFPTQLTWCSVFILGKLTFHQYSNPLSSTDHHLYLSSGDEACISVAMLHTHFGSCFLKFPLPCVPLVYLYLLCLLNRFFMLENSLNLSSQIWLIDLTTSYQF